MANGWGQGAWNAVGWGGIGNISFAVTGVAGTGEIGDEGVSATSVVVETGLQATVSVGTVSASSIFIITPVGVVGTTTVGNVLPKIPITFSVTGVSGTTEFLSGWGSSVWGGHIWGGGVFADVGQVLAVSTNVAQGLVQTPTIIGDCNFSVTGVAGTVSVGNEVVDAEMRFVATGMSATGAVGDEGVTGTSVVVETGLSASALISGYESATVSKIVTVQDVSGANKYFIDGVQQATLDLYEENTYRFDQSDSSNNGHPLRFSLTSNGSHGGGSEYTNGVTTSGTPGNAGAYTEITIPNRTNTLYYYCTNHSAMGGTANTPDVYTILTTTGAPVTNVIGTMALGSESVTAGANIAITLAGLSISTGTLAISGGSVLSLTGITILSSVGAENVYGLIEPTQEANWIERAA
tara:strand:- start:510 stop:1733 length:1224 start_codon:yes stop_codon:yes gene_type:complete